MAYIWGIKSTRWMNLRHPMSGGNLAQILERKCWRMLRTTRRVTGGQIWDNVIIRNNNNLLEHTASSVITTNSLLWKLVKNWVWPCLKCIPIDEGKLFLTEECQSIDAERMIAVGSHHFANFDEITDSGKDHHRIPNPPGESLLITRPSICCQDLSPQII